MPVMLPAMLSARVLSVHDTESTPEHYALSIEHQALSAE